MIEISSKHFSMRHDDHDHDDEDNEGAITAKIVAMCVLFVASMLLGCLPIRLSTWLKWDKSIKQNQTVKLLLCIGGGVLLSTTFIHLLPEVNEQIEDLQTDGVIPELDFHLGHLLMCAGFFVMYLVEELVHTYLDHRRKGNLETLRRTLSVRRGESDKTSEELPKSANGQKLAGPNDYDHGHGEHHHHSHVDHSHVVFEDTVVSSIRGLLIVLALSVHELFEGLAVGLESSTSNVWLMFGAVSAHKLVIAFCIGVELVYSGTKTVLSVIYIFTFAVVSPLGIGIGIAVTENTDTETSLVSVILQGFACGTLLYVVFFEVLQGDRKIGLKSWLAVLAGFAVMFVITIFTGHSHSHSHNETSSETTTTHSH